MKLLRNVVPVLVVTLAGCATVNTEERIAASRDTIGTMKTRMQATLQSTMKEHGPIKAIEVCRNKAPKMAAMMSDKTGWQIGRTSLKLRNPANAPDAWEQKVLNEFETRKAAGTNPETLEYSEVVSEDGKRYFRYMKAIPAGAPCMTCHAGEIDQKLEAQINQLYPDDKARGYKVGDIRGAFTIKQPL
ncbi:MAG: DUF3365 domain-containing protein [Gammaproteobacteria bacterium]|nr:DUF3365 domain-containing protein [Gammaproteobacteria bacterium]